MTDIQCTQFLLQVISKICTAFASAKFMTNCQNMNFLPENLKNSWFCATTYNCRNISFSRGWYFFKCTIIYLFFCLFIIKCAIILPKNQRNSWLLAEIWIFLVADIFWKHDFVLHKYAIISAKIGIFY